MLTATMRDETGQFSTLDDLDAISELIPDPRRTMWVDIEDPTPRDFTLPELADGGRRWRHNAEAIPANLAPASAPDANGPLVEAAPGPLAAPAAAESGIGVLIYSLLDTIVDGYAPVLTDVTARVEELED